MNTLKTIQTLSKIGKIISKIIFVCCVVGFCGCVVGIVSLAIGADTVKLGGTTIHGIIANDAGMNMPTLYVAMADSIWPGVEKVSVGEFSSVGLGVMMIVLALFCRHGAEQKAGD